MQKDLQQAKQGGNSYEHECSRYAGESGVCI